MCGFARTARLTLCRRVHEAPLTRGCLTRQGEHELVARTIRCVDRLLFVGVVDRDQVLGDKQSKCEVGYFLGKLVVPASTTSYAGYSLGEV